MTDPHLVEGQEQGSGSVREIAAKLTKAQRDAVTGLRSVEGVWYNLRGSRAGGAFSRMCDRLAAAGLVDRHGPHPLTSLGIAVRQHLQDQPHD